MTNKSKAFSIPSAYASLIGVLIAFALVLGVPALIGLWVPDALRTDAICVAKYESVESGQFFVLQELGNDFYGARLIRISPSGALDNYVIDGDASKYWSAFSAIKFNPANGVLSFISLGKPICDFDTKQNLFYRTWSGSGPPLDPYNQELSTSSAFARWIREYRDTNRGSRQADS